MIGTSKPTLFLDIDGVLHPSLAMADQYCCRMPPLVEAMTDLDIAVVISSSWRFHHQWGALHRFFPPSIRVKLKACTGPAKARRHARFSEISNYVYQHKAQNWCAVDDVRLEFPADCQERILRDGQPGISQDEIFKLCT